MAAAVGDAAILEEPVPAGVLAPSGTLKDVIDKTAMYYRKAGPSFEEKIFAQHKTNPQFSFLFPNDPYHKYYLFRKGEWKAEEKPRELTVQTVVSEKAAIVAKPSLRPPPLPFTETPPPYEFLLDRIPEISAQDLDIMKLTAQFVARNGREFHIGLVNKEAKNAQFDFLKLNHPLNPYFNQFVEAYNRVLLPRRDFLDRLKRESQPDGKFLVMQRVFGRVEHQRRQEKAKQTEEDEEKERLARQAIEWHEFIVVETITFDEPVPAAAPAPANAPAAPAPAPAAGAASATGAGAAAAAAAAAAKKDEEMEVEMETEEMEVEMVKPAPEMRIRKDYVPGQKAAAAAAAAGRFQICPKCGQQIPTDEMAEHMKVELAGGGTKPKYKPGAANAALASNDEMAASLNVFARRRTDIFGGDELDARRKEAAKAAAAAAEKAAWDGHAASADATKAAHEQHARTAQGPAPTHHIGPTDPTSAAAAAAAAAAAPSVVIKQLAPPPPKPAALPFPPPLNAGIGVAAPGLMPPHALGLPPGLAPPPGLGFGAPMHGAVAPHAGGPVHAAPVEGDDGPDSKRQRTEGEAHLVPEEAFMRSLPAAYTVRLQCPGADEKPTNSDWRIAGQLLELPAAGGEAVSAFKNKVRDATGVPPNKQKLRVANGPVFRDVCTLAFYNVAPGAVIELALKERGGKKKGQ